MMATKRVNPVGQASRVIVVGAVLNLVLAGAKVLVGLTAHSQALVADGVHSASDLATDVIVWLGIRWGRAKADESHPFGHGRIETLASMLVAAALAATALGLAWQAASGLWSGQSAAPGRLAAGLALVSMVAKEWLYIYTLRAAKKLASPALEANAWHHRTDSLSSLAVLAGLGAAVIWPSLAFLDKVAALLVACFILQAAWSIGRRAVLEMVDTAPSQATVDRINSLIMAAPGVLGVRSSRIRRSAGRFQVDADVVVSGKLTLSQAHTVAEVIEGLVKNGEPRVELVTIHLEPDDDDHAVGDRDERLGPGAPRGRLKS